MKKLLCKLTVLALFILLFHLLFLLAPFLPNDPMHIYKQKHLLLANSPGKQIICIGGSGTFYSTSATLIENRIKGYDAVNMGYNAGIGLRLNLNEIKPYVDAGDIIILIPEYCNYEGGLEGSAIALLAMNIYPKVLESTPIEHIRNLLRSDGLNLIPLKCLHFLNSLGTYLSNTSYYSMDQNGDIILRDTPKDVEKIKFSTHFVDASYEDCVTLLNDFHSFCIKRNATAVLLFPALPTQHYESAEPQITTLYNDLSRDIRMPILHFPEQATYPFDCFHDSEYHMNSKGRENHTLFIIDRLKKFYPELGNGH